MPGKYMIRSDVEGVTGVVSYEQVEPGKSQYAYGVKMFMKDLLALVQGLNDGGAEEIVIYDEHYYGMNIDVSLLPANTKVICGKPPYRSDWAGGLDDSFQGMIMLGFHSMNATQGGLLAHTYEPDIESIWINGKLVGEIGVETAIAGDCGVPMVMITGDSAGIAEARVLVPDVAFVVVKESLGDTGALCYSSDLTSELIYQQAKEIAQSGFRTVPWQVWGVVELIIKLKGGIYRDTFEHFFKEQMLDAATVRIRDINTTSAWAAYWQLKLVCQSYLKGVVK